MAALSVLWLAIGGFAVGLEGFLIAGLLPILSGDLGVSISSVSQLISVFGITYAIGSPFLVTITSGIKYRSVLVGGFVAFAAANLLAATASTFEQLLCARVLLALSAGLVMPSAYATAAAVAPQGKSGRAVALLTGGSSIAVTLGVPFGIWTASMAGWRTTFLLIGGIAFLVALALALTLPANITRTRTTLTQRIAAARLPNVPSTLGITVLWSTSGFVLYTFVGPFFTEALDLPAQWLGAIIGLYGLAGLGGSIWGGHTADRVGPNRVTLACLATLILSFASLSFASSLSFWIAAPLTLVAIVLWGFAGWAFGPAQALRLIRLVPESAPVVLSLNASALYAGIAAGSVLGAAAIEMIGVASLGFVSAACAAGGLALLMTITRSK